MISHDRWFLDRIATHVLAFEGDSQVRWFEGNFTEYEEYRHRELGAAADQPPPDPIQAARRLRPRRGRLNRVVLGRNWYFRLCLMFAIAEGYKDIMSPRGASARILVSVVLGALLSGVGLAPSVQAAAPDRSNVVVVLDFSASILNDKTNRDRFAAALERIAARVDETSSDLVAGDATVSIVQFAAKAADYAGCADVTLLEQPGTVSRFADCLRSVAGAYRKGVDPALTHTIGIDTNYVAAMEQAAKHLPLDAVRPAIILFTDGKHDVKAVPVARCRSLSNGLFGTRSPFALLPVGMGLEAKDRGALEAGLGRMRAIREMPACVSGATFDWPQVVFGSATDAGNAVAVAFQDATCTFTVAPGVTPPPTSVEDIGAVQGVAARAGDGLIDVTWSPAARRTAHLRLPGPLSRGRRRLGRVEGGRVASCGRPSSED